MGIDNKDIPTGIQRFNLDGLRSALGVINNATHEQVFGLYRGLNRKIDTDLSSGFSTWVTENDLGHAAVYNKAKNAWFLAKKMIINGFLKHIEVTGNYSTGNKRIAISVDNELGSPFLSCRVFLDGLLVANRTSPTDWAGAQADAFTRNLVEGRGEDPSRLDSTLREDRSPYPFALKMLQDFSSSSPDMKRIKQMFEKMSKGSSVTVWNKDYRIK